jgi:general secretion pathway protein E
LSAELKQLIASKADLGSLRQQAMREGMKSLRIAGAKKVAAGLTTIEEIMKVAPAVNALG